jgi:hypothetical protein
VLGAVGVALAAAAIGLALAAASAVPPQQPLNSPQFELIAEGQQCTGDETTLLVKYINKLL